MIRSKYDILAEQMEVGRKTNMFLFSLNEAELHQASDKLVAKLYSNVVEKYNAMDVKDISNSKGDITNYSGYPVLKDTVVLLRQLSDDAGVKGFQHLEFVEEALRYLEQHTALFTRAYMTDNNIMKVIYETTVYALLVAVNVLISIYVTYVKTPNLSLAVSVEMYKKKNMKEYVLFKSLRDFNKACRAGELEKLAAGSEKTKKFIGIGATSGLAIFGAFIGIALVIVPIIRSLVYAVYDLRMSTSELLNNQADLLRMNADLLKDNNGTATRVDRKKVIQKQMQTVDKLKKFADKIEVKFEESDRNAKKELNKKVSADELSSSGFGFDGDNGLMF